jgi:hypothetical protein
MENGQFDFWIGEWALTWAENGRGRNVVTKILDGKLCGRLNTKERINAETQRRRENPP